MPPNQSLAQYKAKPTSNGPQKRKFGDKQKSSYYGDNKKVSKDNRDEQEDPYHGDAPVKKVVKKAKDDNQPTNAKNIVALEGVFDPNARLEDLDLVFNNLPISDQTKKAVVDFGFESMTEVQARTIPVLLTGRDVLGAAKTGSGKTLAFLIPAIELLINNDFKMRNGTGILVISPTRELCMQIYDNVQHLCKYHSNITHGVIMGGTKKSAEASRLVRGIMLLVATPGRLIDHMDNTPGFKFDSLLSLVIDEADRILEIGFEETLRAIIKKLPEKRQTVFFSATQTKSIQDVARVSVRSPVSIGVENKEKTATAVGIDQGFVIVEAEKRFLLLYSFIKRAAQKKKVIIFMSTCNAVQYYTELLNYIDVPVLDLHGKQAQAKRTKTFLQFCNASQGILLCTDVAARGLDIPAVDWIVQFDPPTNTKEYIHRVGRTARGVGTKGKALLFLLPEELRFLDHLKAAKVPLNEFDFPAEKIANVQPQLEKLVGENVHLHKSAREAYISYMNGYAQHPMKDVFNASLLDLGGVGKSFGFATPPRVALQISVKARKNADVRAAEIIKANNGDVNKEVKKKLADSQRQWSR